MTEPSTRMPISFDPVAGDLPDGLLLPPKEGGEVVALLVDPGTGLDGWALRVGRGLARGWAGSGRSVVLVDVHVDEPGLHRLIGEDNGEGISDAIRFGVSRPRVTRSLDREPFTFVSAGTVITGRREFWRSRRWGAILDGYRDEGQVVLLFLPAGDPDVTTVAREADRAFWIGRSDAALAGSFPDARAIVPPASSGDPASRGSSHGRSTGDVTGPSQDSLAPRLDRGGADGSVKGKASSSHGRRASAAGGEGNGKRRGPGLWLVLLILLVVLLLGAAVAHWLGFLAVPGLPDSGDAVARVVSSTTLLAG